MSEDTFRDPNVDALTEGEMSLLQKLLGNWLVLPGSFKSALSDYVGMTSTIPISQVHGFTQFIAQQDAIATSQTTTSTSFVDLDTVGPQLTELSRGKYIFFYGAQIAAVTAGSAGLMTVLVNGSDIGVSYRLSGFGIGVSAARAFVYDLTENSNTVKLRYASFDGNTAGFSNRWLVGLRIANL